MKFQVVVFWVMTTRSEVVGYHRFGGPYCPLLHEVKFILGLLSVFVLNQVEFNIKIIVFLMRMFYVRLEVPEFVFSLFIPLMYSHIQGKQHLNTSRHVFSTKKKCP